MTFTLRGRRRLPAALLLCGLVVAGGVFALNRQGQEAIAVGPPVSAQDKVLLRGAEERLIRECMSAAGFTYYEKPRPPKSGEPDFPYVVTDVAWARANGYGVKQSAPPADPTAQYFAGLSKDQQDAWRTTLVGSGKQISVELAPGERLSVSDKGCIASARRTLYGDLPGWFKARRTVDNLEFLVQDKVRRDQRYGVAMADWAGCVRGRGYDAGGPGALREIVAQRIKGRAADVVRAAELDAAVVEATCANSTSLAATLLALEPEHRASVTADHRRELAELNVFEQTALPRARSALRQ
ncbi:hypothetical protein AB0P21_18865 [Kribbella sp. NPDC056861]|uniref:hypothetical protein n=1 Tax=Kribbella sp. NPDC056861 TaxID=3154857 RepID=UPI00343C1822